MLFSEHTSWKASSSRELRLCTKHYNIHIHVLYTDTAVHSMVYRRPLLVYCVLFDISFGRGPLVHSWYQNLVTKYIRTNDIESEFFFLVIIIMVGIQIFVHKKIVWIFGAIPFCRIQFQYRCRCAIFSMDWRFGHFNAMIMMCPLWLFQQKKHGYSLTLGPVLCIFSIEEKSVCRCFTWSRLSIYCGCCHNFSRQEKLSLVALC